MTDERKEAVPDPDSLEEGMRVAFGGESIREGESVLGAIERISGMRSRIYLPDDEEDSHSPVVRVPPAESDDAPKDDLRYQILGEIARGGVGVILKARDRDLGRDVALKVLRKDLQGSPEIIQRFIEEAQIEGQLQHPGIIPVYGLGIQADGRPYFAMKLVKGQTLAARLKDRRDPAEDRRSLVAVFEDICQTVAFAHARRVVHRDLKPSNVIIGTFGQVQVVDWGFAKVLDRGGLADERPAPPETPDVSVIETVRSGEGSSVSQVGSVMGTPAYMPPEQARGEVDKLDERSDVFSLGAVLTEILTGLPPYTGETRELVLQAADCRLDDALARLDECDADPELVSIARRCLSPARKARPRHAGELAEAIGAHLASLEELRREAASGPPPRTGPAA